MVSSFMQHIPVSIEEDTLISVIEMHFNFVWMVSKLGVTRESNICMLLFVPAKIIARTKNEPPGT